MKKYLTIVFVCLITIIMTGCGSKKTLECSMDYSSSIGMGITMIQDVKLDFSGDKVEKVLMTMTLTLPDSLKSSMSRFLSTYETQMNNQYGKYDGVNVKVNQLSDTKFEIVIDMDYKNMSPVDRKATGFGTSDNGKYDDIKKELVGGGYKCK